MSIGGAARAGSGGEEILCSVRVGSVLALQSSLFTVTTERRGADGTAEKLESLLNLVFSDVLTRGDPVLNVAEESAESGLSGDVVLFDALDELGALGVHGNIDAVRAKPSAETIVGPREVVVSLAVGG